jgi:hypothetical protein
MMPEITIDSESIGRAGTLSRIRTDPPLTGGPDRFAGALALGVTLAGLAVAIVLCIASDGFYHDDDITHYAFAAQGWSNIGTLFNWWGRPGLTIPMAPVAHWFGLLGCRIFSSLMTAATAYLAYLIARRILASLPRGAYLAALAPALVWLQPLTMTLAATTLTETPAGLYLTLGVWLFMRGNKIAGPIVTSFAFISRFEILTLAPIMWAMAAYEALKQSNWKPSSLLKTWPCALGLLAAPIAYAIAAIILEHIKTSTGGVILSPSASPLHMFDNPYKGADEYGTGGWSHFLIQWVMAAGPGILGLAVAGALCFARKAIVPTLLALQLVAAETVLYHYGLFASGGYARFLVPIGGLTAAAAAAGLAAVVLSHRKFGAGISLAVIGAVLLVATVTSGDASGKTLANLWLIWSRLGQAVTAIRGLSSPDPDLVSQTVAAMTVAWIVLGIIGLASVVARARPARIALATIAVLTTTAFVGAAAFEIRPLSIASSSMHVVVRDAVRQLEQTPYADNPCLTCHVLVGQLRTGQTIGGLNFHSACEAWEKSPPGTLFFWENKYCIRSARRGEDRPEHPQDELGIALARDGQMIAFANNFEANGDDCAEVYVRDDPKATSRALGQPDKD